MTRFRLAAGAALATAALALGASAQAATPTLTATVGPGFNITLKTASGAKVTKLKAGTYTITVRDRSNIHNFALKGPGVAKDSGVAFVGTRTWTVRLKAGTYKYVCTPHAMSMVATFRVV